MQFLIPLYSFSYFTNMDESIIFDSSCFEFDGFESNDIQNHRKINSDIEISSVSSADTADLSYFSDDGENIERHTQWSK